MKMHKDRLMKKRYNNLKKKQIILKVLFLLLYKNLFQAIGISEVKLSPSNGCQLIVELILITKYMSLLNKRNLRNHGKMKRIILVWLFQLYLTLLMQMVTNYLIMLPFKNTYATNISQLFQEKLLKRELRLMNWLQTSMLIFLQLQSLNTIQHVIRMKVSKGYLIFVISIKITLDKKTS